MTGSRRVRKRAVSTCPVLPTYVAVLEPLQLDLQTTRDRNKRPVFTLQVQRRQLSIGSGRQSLQTSWSLSRPFEDYESLHKRLMLALQHGHFCNAGCPWLFSFLSSNFPKKNIFQRSSSVKTVERRQKKLLELLTGTMEFLLDKTNHNCSVATTDVAKPLAEFLYGESQLAQYIAESYSEENSSSRRRSLCEDEDDVDDSICGVCRGTLMCEPEPSNRNVAERSGSSASPADSSSRRRSSVFATSLHCGHQFHDECIVPVLNKTLRCPTCKHVEIQ